MEEKYTITIKNTGTAAASGWKFSDVLPAGMELDSTVAKVTIEGGSTLLRSLMIQLLVKLQALWRIYNLAEDVTIKVQLS